MYPEPSLCVFYSDGLIVTFNLQVCCLLSGVNFCHYCNSYFVSGNSLLTVHITCIFSVVRRAFISARLLLTLITRTFILCYCSAWDSSVCLLGFCFDLCIGWNPCTLRPFRGVFLFIRLRDCFKLCYGLNWLLFCKS